MLALVLASCGGDDGTPPSRLEQDGGDERPISVVVDVALSDDATTVSPRVVAAFLPLRFVITGDGRVSIPGVGSRTVRDRAVLRSAGLPDGRVRISGPGGAAVLRVKPGG